MKSTARIINKSLEFFENKGFKTFLFLKFADSKYAEYEKNK